MRKIILLIIICGYSIISAQDEQMSQEQQAWMEYMTPGKMHKILADFSGEWVTSTKTWMMPNADPMISQGTSSNKMILGGRYLQMEQSGSTMGMTFQGISIEGYDNVKKKFVNIWVDNMGTGIASSEGTYDPETNTITYAGTMSDPMTNGDVKFKNVMEIKDNNTYVFSMYMDMNGEEHKWMEMTYTKK